MEYKILSYRTDESLASAINEHLSDGWKLQGGVSVTQAENNSEWYMVYAQAVTRKSAQHRLQSDKSGLGDAPENLPSK